MLLLHWGLSRGQLSSSWKQMKENSTHGSLYTKKPWLHISHYVRLERIKGLHQLTINNEFTQHVCLTCRWAERIHPLCFKLAWWLVVSRQHKSGNRVVKNSAKMYSRSYSKRTEYEKSLATFKLCVIAYEITHTPLATFKGRKIQSQATSYTHTIDCTQEANTHIGWGPTY